MEIVDRIFALMREQGIEQKKFAVAVGVAPQKVSEWKIGKAKSYTKYIPQIAAALNTTPDYLLTGDGPKHPAKTEQAATPKGSGLTEEFAKLFESLTPEHRTEIIAEMLKRQREK